MVIHLELWSAVLDSGIIRLIGGLDELHSDSPEHDDTTEDRLIGDTISSPVGLLLHTGLDIHIIRVMSTISDFVRIYSYKV